MKAMQRGARPPTGRVPAQWAAPRFSAALSKPAYHALTPGEANNMQSSGHCIMNEGWGAASLLDLVDCAGLGGNIIFRTVCCASTTGQLHVSRWMQGSQCLLYTRTYVCQQMIAFSRGAYRQLPKLTSCSWNALAPQRLSPVSYVHVQDNISCGVLKAAS